MIPYPHIKVNQFLGEQIGKEWPRIKNTTNGTEQRVYIELWKYNWGYKKATNEFVIFKQHFKWNGKKQKPIKGVTPVLSMQVTFEVKWIEREVTREHYDWGEWCVSERGWTTTEKITEFDREPFLQLFNDQVALLPPHPIKIYA